MTTEELQELLAARYPSDRYALFFDVPDKVGTNQRRRADAIAIGCWNSVGHLVEGFEMKVSRSDWLREVKQVQKADPFIERCDKWWLVTADASIAKEDEIPACWGWMAATKSGLRVQRPAQRLPQDDSKIDRMFAIGLFRKMQGDMLASPEVRRVLKSAADVRDAEIEKQVIWRTERNTRRINELTQRIEKFETSSGLKLDDWRLGDVGKLARVIADMSADEGFNDAVDKQLDKQERSLSELVERIKDARAAISGRVDSDATAGNGSI